MSSDDHIQWCKNIMSMLRDNGVWGVPRSGLTFTKRGDTLVLTKRSGVPPDVRVVDHVWAHQQEEEFAAVKKHFGAAGFKVIDETLR